MTSCDPTDPRHSFVRRLTTAYSEGPSSLAAVRHWRPGDVDADVLGLVGETPREDFRWFATTAKLFALWHRGRPSASDGSAGEGIGRWTRQLGMRDPCAQRLLRRILDADTDEDLTTALVVLATKRTRHAPHWDTVVAELLGWADPTFRAEIRFAWGHDFYRYLTPQTKSRRVG